MNGGALLRMLLAYEGREWTLEGSEGQAVT